MKSTSDLFQMEMESIQLGIFTKHNTIHTIRSSTSDNNQSTWTDFECENKKKI